MTNVTNIELSTTLSEPTVFFDLNGTTYALLAGGSDQVLTGDMDGISLSLTAQLYMYKKDDGLSYFSFDDEEFTIVTDGKNWAESLEDIQDREQEKYMMDKIDSEIEDAEKYHAEMEDEGNYS